MHPMLINMALTGLGNYVWLKEPIAAPKDWDKKGFIQIGLLNKYQSLSIVYKVFKNVDFSRSKKVILGKTIAL